MDKPVTLVTGVSRGIGAAIASDLTSHGHHVVGIARKRPEDFTGTFIAADLADADAARQAYAEATSRYPVRRLVNNAGIANMASVEAASLEDFDRMMAVNVRAVLQAMQAVLPAMKAQKFGRIVTIGSRASQGKEGRAIYSSTKAAINGLTRTVAMETATYGITVNCVAPGPVETDMIRQNYAPGTAARTEFENQIPMRRFGQPEEVATAVRYFLSDHAGFTTGQVLYVCGGASVGITPV